MNRSEKTKMLAGELYNAFDEELLRERNHAKQLCFELNQTSPLETDRRKAIVKRLIVNSASTCWIESPFHCDYGYNLIVGHNFYANHGCTILDGNRVTIGNHCLLAPHVCLSTATHPVHDAVSRARGDEFTAPITIGHNCWIGANATVCPGVTLGHNVVVGAGAVVTKSFPDNVVVGGVPARILRHLDQSNNNNNDGNDADATDVLSGDVTAASSRVL